MKPVKRECTWYELLGTKQNDMPDKLRRERREEWKNLAITNGDIDIVEIWTDISGCINCTNRDNDWCKYAQLPCTINPILTMKYGMIGMACCGVGHEDIYVQKELFV
jgi:hypothetical protein